MSLTNTLTILTTILLTTNPTQQQSSVCKSDDKTCTNHSENLRFLFYDVNPPEGFNLRRDVYLRYAIFAHKLSKIPKHSNFRLVLPPWSRLYHWKRSNVPERLPWSVFFDVRSLKAFAPVIEMHEYFDLIGPKYSKVKLDEVYVLQHFEDMFESGNFEDRMQVNECSEKINVNFFYYENITSDNIKCMSFHGYASQLINVIDNTSASTIMIDHAEIALHESFGDKTYWKARRSMRFNPELLEIARSYRKKFLSSTDESDETIRPSNWRLEKAKRTAKGGPYLSVHLRRRDFLWGRSKDVPSTVENAASQISKALETLNLKQVFIATDASETEYEDLVKLLSPYKVFRFDPIEMNAEYRDGSAAIVDQIICAHARFFIGTHESTFTFRIQEEREIIGFKPETTFNRLCGDNATTCKKPSAWKIVF